MEVTLTMLWALTVSTRRRSLWATLRGLRRYLNKLMKCFWSCGHRPFGAPAFSHEDLLPDNIMYDPESHRITAIIDWEHAGCYPYFWDIFVTSRMTAPNWKAIYSASMEDCGRAAANFGWYYSMTDVYGTFELPDAR